MGKWITATMTGF